MTFEGNRIFQFPLENTIDKKWDFIVRICLFKKVTFHCGFFFFGDLLTNLFFLSQTSWFLHLQLHLIVHFNFKFWITWGQVKWLAWGTGAGLSGRAMYSCKETPEFKSCLNVAFNSSCCFETYDLSYNFKIYSLECIISLNRLISCTYWCSHLLIVPELVTYL